MNRTERRAQARAQRIAQQEVKRLRQRTLKIADSAYYKGSLTEVQKEKLYAMVDLAYVQLSTGYAQTNDVQTIAYAVNMAAAMATTHKLGIGEWEHNTIRDAQSAVDHLDQRVKDHGRWLATGVELIAIREALLIYRTQLDYATPGRFVAAQTEVRKAAESGEYAKGVTV